MTAAIGNIENDSFIKQIKQETGDFYKFIEKIKKIE
jgi:hypothetical protein